jgi:glycosyltransferase involved in cell wall biosynthesis
MPSAGFLIQSKHIMTSAIIPAYNEAKRIKPVLEAVTASRYVDEVIVVDDGSDDGLERVVAGFPQVKFIRNGKNRGKGHCMELGAKEARGDILLFCDSDLTGLAAEMVDSVVQPVQEGQCDMYIGMFSTPSRKFYDQILKVTAFPSGINSGLRAMSRRVWDKLPAYYKRSYQTESGLNYMVLWNFNGPRYKLLPYTQVLKERKYGLWEGTVLRWKMHWEVTAAFLRIQLYERFFGFGKAATARGIKLKLKAIKVPVEGP